MSRLNNHSMPFKQKSRNWTGALVGVMGGDSCSEGRGFESQHRILDEHFFTLICCKNWMDVCLKKIENKRKGGNKTHAAVVNYFNQSRIFVLNALRS